MNADLLRLILIIAGILLILGIYFWDKYKQRIIDFYTVRKRQASRLKRVSEQQVDADAQPKIEPVWNSEEPISLDESSDNMRKPELAGIELPVDEERDVGFNKKAQLDQTVFSFTAESSVRESQDAKIPFKIFQINIVPKGGRFSGEKILEVTKKFGLHYGDMNIFHCYTGSTVHAKVLFSMTSMVEPGIFPSATLEDYSTPGLTLFTQLPGPMDSLTTFSKMVSTAKDIAAALDATLQDESHSDLTRQRIEHMRAEILELHRQVQLARSRQ